MKAVIDSCRPKGDVLSGSIDDSVFAADLYAVYTGRAPPVYGDPQTFFDNTYPTNGLTQLLSEVFGRLSGAKPDANSGLKLEAPLGEVKQARLSPFPKSPSGRERLNRVLRFVDEEMIRGLGVHVPILVGFEYAGSS